MIHTLKCPSCSAPLDHDDSDGDGRYLRVFKPSPIAFGMVFNDNKELFVAARTQVFKLTLNEP